MLLYIILGTVLHCTVLYCTVLYCTVLSFYHLLHLGQSCQVPTYVTIVMTTNCKFYKKYI
jgi:hypothetical protein